MAKNRDKKVQVPGEEGTAKIETEPTTPGGPGGALSAPRLPSRLIRKLYPADIISPYQRMYPTGGLRPLVEDEVQVYSEVWAWTMKGYHTYQSFATATLPLWYDDAAKFLQNWYPQQVLKTQSKLNTNLPITSTTLNDVDSFNTYHQLYHWARATSTFYCNLDKLYQYNEGLASLLTYLPKYISRIKRVFRGLDEILAAKVVIEESWRDGQIPYIPGVLPVMLRGWSCYKAGATYLPLGTQNWASASYTYHNPATILATDAEISAVTTDLENALLALQGLPYVANDKADFQNIQTLMRYSEQVEPGFFGRDTRTEDDLPGVVMDVSYLDDWKCGALYTYDTKGASGDEVAIFPHVGVAGFDNRIPVKSFTSKDNPRIYSLWDRFKFGICDSATPGYAAYNEQFMFFGNKIPLPNGVGSGATNVPPHSLYTREDGWVSIDPLISDYGDGAGIRAALNSGLIWHGHVFWKHVFKSQLTTNLEYRFLNDTVTPVTVFVQEADFMDNYLTDLSRALNIPKL